MPILHDAVVQTSIIYLRVVTRHNIHYVVTQQKGLAKDSLHVNGSMGVPSKVLLFRNLDDYL